MKAALIVLLALVVLAAARPKWNDLPTYTFKQFTKDFHRKYPEGSDEYKKRETIFNTKVADMIAHNSDASHSWKRGVNMFTDMTKEEWKRFNAFRKSPNRPAPMSVYKATTRSENLPMEVDYRTWTSPRVLTEVKHQGSCGNCWANSAAESVESYYALQTGMTPVLSIQQITSCDTADDGCNGGDYATGWQYVNSTKGLTEEWAYPFTNFFFNISNPNAPTAPCIDISTLYPPTPYTWFAELNEAGVLGYSSVTVNDAHSAMEALAKVGPLSISVAAGNWQDYESGVMNNTAKYGPDNEWQIDHAVQMVGYGHDKDLGLDYWIVRNSWSTLWGEDGFVKLLRPAVEPCSPAAYGPVCGVSGCLCDPQYPLVVKNTPTPF